MICALPEMILPGTGEKIKMLMGSCVLVGIADVGGGALVGKVAGTVVGALAASMGVALSPGVTVSVSVCVAVRVGSGALVRLHALVRRASNNTSR